MTDRLPALAALLDGLDEVPVAEHPDTLEAVQAALVAELDALAGAGRARQDDAAAGVPRP